MDISKIFVMAAIVAAYSIWSWFSTRQARQRRALGIQPAAGQNYGTYGPVSGKRCRRGVCTTPGASCPLECVEEPEVTTLVDGSQVHVYENMEVQYGPTGSLWSLTVDGKTWI